MTRQHHTIIDIDPTVGTVIGLALMAYSAKSSAEMYAKMSHTERWVHAAIAPFAFLFLAIWGGAPLFLIGLVWAVTITPIALIKLWSSRTRRPSAPTTPPNAPLTRSQSFIIGIVFASLFAVPVLLALL